MISYIVACYMGERRQDESSDIHSTPLEYIKNHIKWLETAEDVGKALFVFNDASYIKSSKQNEAVELVIKAGHDYIIRDNIDFSYGAWEEGIKRIIKDDKYNYSFLIEDDYIPSLPSMLKFYLECMNDNIAFVASFYMHKNRPHAAISNGLISYKAIRETISESKEIFQLYERSKLPPNVIGQTKEKFIRNNIKYPAALSNQKSFLLNIISKSSNYRATDITKKNYTKFYNPVGTSIGLHLFGNKDGICLSEPNFQIPNTTKNYGYKSFETKTYIGPSKSIFKI